MLSTITASLPLGCVPPVTRLKELDKDKRPRLATKACWDVELTGTMMRGAWIDTERLTLELWDW